MIIVGLGNITTKYENTYHNMGFMVMDKIAKKLDLNYRKTDCKALIDTKFIGGERMVFAKPQTYMNLSGESVRELVGKYAKDKSELLVIYDDIDLPFSSIRVRSEGSAGTHNGMRSIIGDIGQNFARVRVGIGKPEVEQMALVDYVLSKVSTERLAVLDKVFDDVADKIISYLSHKDIDRLMRELNKQ